MARLAAVLVFAVVATARAAAPASLSSEDRVRCQEALERVRWSHRTEESGRPFAQAVPEAVVRKRAEDALLKTAALRRFWSRPIAPEQLQAELDRMAAHSQAPGRLREIFAALGDDPTTAAECLARPILADRLLRSYYAHDERLHGELSARARQELREIASASASEPSTGVRTELEWRRRLDRRPSPGVRELEPDDFDARVRDLETAMGRPNGEITLDRPSPLREDDTRFYALVVHDLDDSYVRLSTIEWPKRPFEQWWEEVRGELTPGLEDARFDFRLPAVGAACTDDTWSPTLQLLDPRYWHTAVWTGSEMIVWGGMEAVGFVFGDGSRYDPVTDSWTLLSMTGAPSPRQTHVAVWTGTEMVVWGATNDRTGGRYNPVTDSWAPTSTVNAPAPRWYASVVWTGTEMVVWGGEGGGGLNNGGRYDPATDTWTSMATAPLTGRLFHAAAWTGSEMVVWGGSDPGIGQVYGDGARYSPAANSWTPMTGVNAPNPRSYHTAVWTGSEVIVWGGLNWPVEDPSGGRYDPVADTWTPTSMVDAPSYRYFHAAVWTGTEMIIQGGSEFFNPPVAGGRYDPTTDTWTPTNPVNSANNGQGITAVWTGTEMIVWGGLDDDFEFHFDGGRYDPATDLWHPTNTLNVPTLRNSHSAAWTGSEMLIWGGYSYGFPNTGSLYDPATDSWRTATTTGAPDGREGAPALWTGSEVLIWGGEPDGPLGSPGTGGLYDPATDSWRLTTTDNAAGSRYGHTAVWTGSEMIVFGTPGTETPAIAKRYNPATDVWTDATGVDATDSRSHHAAVWTGTEMIVWGGRIHHPGPPTGGRYNPLTDTWTPIDVTGSPETRQNPIGVWTGSEMIVWGGYDWLLFQDLGDGARYDPATDTWTPTTMVGAPSPRTADAVWTGTEMIVWGGSPFRDGGRYDPATDSWRPTSLDGAPWRPVGYGNNFHTTTWTGEQMIIWGGFTQTGALYCAPPPNDIFADGFESGDMSAWSLVVP